MVSADGLGFCNIHRSDRKAAWVMCSQPIAWDDRGKPTRTCGHRGRFIFERMWYCRMHDPERPRCENVKAHPWSGPVAGVSPIGIMLDPRAPRFARKLFGVRLCAACCKPGGRAQARGSSVPCALCGGTCALEDDRGRPFPCVCTPGGRELANGASDHVVIARLVDAGLFE